MSLQPLSVYKKEVDDFAALCEKDFDGTDESIPNIRFECVDFDTKEESPITGEHLVLTLGDRSYLNTDWSRGQILSHLGTREKWFSSVSLEEQMEELNKRTHTFLAHTFRRMKVEDCATGILRGLVSARYAEIPDTLIAEALVQAASADAKCVAKLSGKTDRASYCALIGDTKPLGIPGVVTNAYPGALIRNSEVGFTSLWVTPSLFVPHKEGMLRPVILRSRAVLRKTHRGSVGELTQSFTDALSKLKDTWGPLQRKLDGLLAISFQSQDDALEYLTKALTSLKASRLFIYSCGLKYSAQKNQKHNGATLFQAVLETISSEQVGLDARYDEGEIAGALLLHML